MNPDIPDIKKKAFIGANYTNIYQPATYLSPSSTTPQNDTIRIKTRQYTKLTIITYAPPPIFLLCTLQLLLVLFLIAVLPTELLVTPRRLTARAINDDALAANMIYCNTVG